ncbi:hypothetical protein QCN27_18490 [Cereibacter sp. SYSU M97828]|nr:hypothetical protein [Cereibacter flavus]
MIPLSPLCLVLRIDRLHDRYPGGWEQFTRDYWERDDDRDATLFHIDARDDAELARIIQKLEAAGLRLARKVGQRIEADMVFLQPPFATDCPWLTVAGGSARFTGTPDPRWTRHRILVNWGKHPPFGWLPSNELFLYAAELAGAGSPREILARALTRMAMTDMLRDDFSLLEIRHGDGRAALLHGYGEQHGFDTPLAITARKGFFDEPRGSGTPYRNFTEILADGWLAESCAGERPAAPFEGITLQEVI